jgi:hypothetical protein
MSKNIHAESVHKEISVTYLIDPATLGNPDVGLVYEGVFNALRWTKDSSGNITYQSSDASQELDFLIYNFAGEGDTPQAGELMFDNFATPLIVYISNVNANGIFSNEMLSLFSAGELLKIKNQNYSATFNIKAITATVDNYFVNVELYTFSGTIPQIGDALSVDQKAQIPYYVTGKNVNVIVTEVFPNYQTIISLPYTIAAAFVILEFKISLTWTLSTDKKSVYFRFSTDNGNTWNDFNMEPSDKTDQRAFYYAFPLTYDNLSPSGSVFILESAKEAVGDNLSIAFADLMIEKVF